MAFSVYKSVSFRLLCGANLISYIAPVWHAKRRALSTKQMWKFGKALSRAPRSRQRLFSYSPFGCGKNMSAILFAIFNVFYFVCVWFSSSFLCVTWLLLAFQFSSLLFFWFVYIFLFCVILLFAMCAWVYALYPFATWPTVYFYNLHQSSTGSWSCSWKPGRFVVNLQNACTD